MSIDRDIAEWILFHKEYILSNAEDVKYIEPIFYSVYLESLMDNLVENCAHDLNLSYEEVASELTEDFVERLLGASWSTLLRLGSESV